MTTPDGPRYGHRGTAPEAEIRAATPGHVTWPYHDPGAGIPPAPPPGRGVPPVRWPQGDLAWFLAIGNAAADPVPMPPLGAGGLVETGQLIFFGGSLVNSATAAATVTLRDGADATGGFLAQVTVPASGNANLNLPRAGVICEIGLWAVVAGGSVTGSLYVAHLWKYPFTPVTE